MMNSRSNSSYILAGVGLSSLLLLAFKPSRKKLQEITGNIKDKWMSSKTTTTKNIPIEKAGNPHPHDIEDNKMVSEGAMYSVNYYNENEQPKGL